MQKVLSLPVILLGLIFSHAAMAEDFRVTSGYCKIKPSDEIVQINNHDPVLYGMFAEGFSSEGDRVWLDDNFGGFIGINIQSAVDGATRENIPISKENDTLVKVQTGRISCELVVRTIGIVAGIHGAQAKQIYELLQSVSQDEGVLHLRGNVTGQANTPIDYVAIGLMKETGSVVPLAATKAQIMNVAEILHQAGFRPIYDDRGRMPYMKYVVEATCQSADSCELVSLQ